MAKAGPLIFLLARWLWKTAEKKGYRTTCCSMQYWPAKESQHLVARTMIVKSKI